jgi:putative transposase
MDKNNLSHTTWECKYHLVFSAKYRRQIIYGKIKQDIGRILRELCDRKGIEIIEAECCKDHIHMLVRIPPKYSVSEIMGYLKGKSSLMIFDKYANLKYKYGNRHFWCRGYYVDTVGKNAKRIEEYIRKHLQEDIANDQLSLIEYVDPFTGKQVKKSK